MVPTRCGPRVCQGEGPKNRCSTLAYLAPSGKTACTGVGWTKVNALSFASRTRCAIRFGLSANDLSEETLNEILLAWHVRLSVFLLSVPS